MARVTVEDCIEKVNSRFDLILLSSHRARMLSSGAPLLVDRDRDKNPVVALREIADGVIHPEDLKEEVIQSLQRYAEVDEPDTEVPVDLPSKSPFGDEALSGNADATISEDEILRFVNKLSQPTQSGRDS